MNKRKVLAAAIVTTFLSVAGMSIAAEGGMNPQNPPATSSGNMMGGGMMGGMMGMKGMMDSCPMMGGGTDALNPQQKMQMHAEMMQAMGQIMQKYASQVQPTTK
jgi:Spy/CpxP family protein refolding chaperone